MAIDLKDLLANIEKNKQEQTGSQTGSQTVSAAKAAPTEAPNAVDEPEYWQPGDPLNDVQEFLKMKGKPLSFIAMNADNPPPDDIAKSYDVKATSKAKPAPVANRISDDFDDDDDVLDETRDYPVKTEEKPAKSGGRKCGKCGGEGHNARTCKAGGTSSGAEDGAEDGEDEDLNDPLDAILNRRIAEREAKAKASAPVAPAPAMAATPAPVMADGSKAIGTLYIDCLPMNKEYITLDSMFDRVAKMIEKGTEKPHFKLVEFGKGVGMVSALVSENLAGWVQGRNVYIDSSSVYVSACVDVLIQNSASVVRGIGG